MNVAERRTWTIEQWARRVLAAAEFDAELVRVPDASLPADLRLTASFQQHQLLGTSRARVLLGWSDIADQTAALLESVRWHLAHPPRDASTDFTDDDKALDAAVK